ncbi:MAG: hypothetical protein F2857_01305, partial [Actinobacteria bacterium]|nr:hypothetical protein [Actinomycetota bacterium]
MVDSSTSFATDASSIAVVIPIKAFEQAKDRLSGVLSTDQRALLARTTALGVLESVWWVQDLGAPQSPHWYRKTLR